MLSSNWEFVLPIARAAGGMVVNLRVRSMRESSEC